MFVWVVFDLIRPSVVKEGVGRARSEESEPTQTSSAKQTNSVGKISKTINQGNPWNRLKTWNQTCAFFWVFVKFKFSGWWLMVDAIHVPGMSLQWISCRQVYRNIEGSSKWEKKKSLVTHPSHECRILSQSLIHRLRYNKFNHLHLFLDSHTQSAWSLDIRRTTYNFELLYISHIPTLQHAIPIPSSNLWHPG